MPLASSYPSIQLKGSNLYIDHHIVALHGRAKTRLLVETMLSETNGVAREKLRKEVYASAATPSGDPEDGHALRAVGPSLRLRESQDGSLSKLISRSRKLLKESLADSPWSGELDWFVYSEATRSWQLVAKKAS